MDYTQYVLKEAYSRMGIEFSIKITNRGYYPKGGGEIKLEVYPSKIKSINLLERKSIDFKLICTFSKIPIKTIKEKIEKIKEKINVKIEIKEDKKSVLLNDEGIKKIEFNLKKVNLLKGDNLFDNENNS